MVLSAIFWVALFSLSLALAQELGISAALLAKITETYGVDARLRVKEWDTLLMQGDGDDWSKLKQVNLFFNDLRFVSDQQHWGKKDYWATPVEFLATGGGDCEDFSLAKYFTLKRLGVSEERLRLTYVKALKLNQAHMVLAYFPEPGAEPYILDNLVENIQPASKRKDLLPVYSFNGDGLWLAKERGQGRRVGSSNRLGLWEDFNHRIEKMPLGATGNDS